MCNLERRRFRSVVSHITSSATKSAADASSGAEGTLCLLVRSLNVPFCYVSFSPRLLTRR